jgi:hypothetical protein
MSLLERDHYEDNILDRIAALEDAVENVLRSAKLGTVTYIAVDGADVSSPPTDAELDAALGEPANVGAGFVALIDDNAAGAAGYLVWSDGANWWYASGTKAT